MKLKFIACFFCLALIPVLSCNHSGNIKETHDTKNRIIQQNDGTISLKLAKADCYRDNSNPSNNTADWNVVISKPGRFKVWLSSATKDTSSLNYTNSVKISLLDDHLEATPSCDKIVRNSDDVHYPYFRADSFMGSIFVSEPGEYNVQLISEKVVEKKTESVSADTQIMSVLLTP